MGHVARCATRGSRQLARVPSTDDRGRGRHASRGGGIRATRGSGNPDGYGSAGLGGFAANAASRPGGREEQ